VLRLVVIHLKSGVYSKAVVRPCQLKKAREKQDSFHDLKKERSFNDWAVKHVLLAAASHHRVVSL